MDISCYLYIYINVYYSIAFLKRKRKKNTYRTLKLSISSMTLGIPFVSSLLDKSLLKEKNILIHINNY